MVGVLDGRTSGNEQSSSIFFSAIFCRKARSMRAATIWAMNSRNINASMRVFFFSQIGALNDAAEGRVSRRFTAGYGLEFLNRIPLDLNRDPLCGTLLGDDLIDTPCNRSVRLGPAHALEIKAIQPLYRALDPLVPISPITLLLLARSVPLQAQPLA